MVNMARGTCAESQIDGIPETDLSLLTAENPSTMPIHFGSSKRSRFYPQALALAEHAPVSIEHGSDSSRWHTVLVPSGSLDLLALLYECASKLPGPKVCGADALSLKLKLQNEGQYSSAYASNAKLQRLARACDELRATLKWGWEDLARLLDERVLRPVQADMVRARELLQEEGFYDRPDPEDPMRLRIIPAWRKPQEIQPGIKRVQEAVTRGSYQEAVEAYYELLAGEPFGELTPELLYIKRLGDIELGGRDLLFFIPPSARSPLVAENLIEFVECIDEAIASYLETGSMLIRILAEGSPTMDQLVRETQDDVRRAVWVEDGELTRDDTVITPDFFGAQYGHCPSGRIFHKYPDQVSLCEEIENEEDLKYHGFWVTYSEDYLAEHIAEKGLALVSVDAYRHKAWNWRGKRGTREPPFTQATRLSEIEKATYGTSGIRYTGRQHKIRGKLFFEVDLVRHVNPKSLGNAFLEAVQDLLRESENLLRERHGLPRIGEGWVSELRLYRLVQAIFPNSIHQARPAWLKPQHLDILDPESSVAFEYQGRQHFEPIDFFGGDEALERLRERDSRKARLCRKHGVTLVAWHYTWPLTRSRLTEALAEFGLDAPGNPRNANDEAVG